MLKDLFSRQKELLNHFFENFDLRQCQRIVDSLLASKGVLFFTGVGKSGFIAQKIAATLMSTGTKAFFLPPIDALHGDLGMIGATDTILILSKSGETDELLHLLPSLRNKGGRTIAITSNPSSRLVKGCHEALHLPCEHELCAFDLAPTTSTEVQLLFGDLLSMALMEARGFSIEAFAQNHPAGRIGRRATTKVGDLMLDQEKTPLCLPTHRLEEVLVEFTDKRCGCLVVTDEEKRLQGIFTDGDLRRALQEKGEQVLKERVGDLMTKIARSIDVDTLAYDAMQKMEADQKHPIMVLPVCQGEENEVIGILKMHDLIQANL